MGQKQISTQSLFFASLLVLSVEMLAAGIIFQGGFNPLAVIGVSRIAEAFFLLIIIKFWSGGLDSIGLVHSETKAGFTKGLAWSVGFGVLAALLLAVLYFFDFNLTQLFSYPARESAADIFLLFLVGALFSPLAEEIFFRGIIYGFLRRWGVLLAILGSTALFCMAHALTTGLTFIQIMGGLVFAIAFEKEKNLLVPITIHILGNTGIFILSLVLTS